MSLPPPDFPVSEDQGPKPTSGLAITSLVLGLLWLCGLGSLMAVIFGHMGLGSTRRGERSGAGIAIAGLVLGYLGLLGTVAMGISLATNWSQYEALIKVEMFEELAKETKKREGALPDSLDQFSNMFSTMDPWGHPYKLVKEDTRFYVVSFGPDGREGTADDLRSDRQ